MKQMTRQRTGYENTTIKTQPRPEKQEQQYNKTKELYKTPKKKTRTCIHARLGMSGQSDACMHRHACIMYRLQSRLRISATEKRVVLNMETLDIAVCFRARMVEERKR